MFIWTAIDVEKYLLKEKDIFKKIDDKIGFVESNVLLLLLHISLKISTEISNEKEQDIKKDISYLLKSTLAFEIEIDKIELNNTIVWIKMKKNDNLLKIHNDLCSLFLNKYNIPLHEFDKEFIYHTTLFLDSDKSKIEEAYNLIKSINLPKKISANRFVIGSSITGSIGTYKVDEIIEI